MAGKPLDLLPRDAPALLRRMALASVMGPPAIQRWGLRAPRSGPAPGQPAPPDPEEP